MIDAGARGKSCLCQRFEALNKTSLPDLGREVFQNAAPVRGLDPEGFLQIGHDFGGRPLGLVASQV